MAKIKQAGVMGLALLVCLTMFSGCGGRIREKQEAFLKEGKAQMSAGNYEQAIEQFDKGLGLSTGIVDQMAVDLCYYKAAAQYANGDFEGAESTYTALMEFDKENPYPCYLRGCIYANEKEMKQALEDYREAVKRCHDDYDLYVEIYENLEALGYHQEALEFLNLALEIDSNSAKSCMQRGRIYLILEQYDAAAKALEKAIDKHLEEAKVYLAQVYQSRGDEEKAHALLEEYVKSDEATSEALNAIAMMELDRGNAKEALAYIRQGLALKEAANRQTLLKNEVAALEYTGDFEQAREKLEEYLQEYPADPEALDELRFLQTR